MGSLWGFCGVSVGCYGVSRVAMSSMGHYSSLWGPCGVPVALCALLWGSPPWAVSPAEQKRALQAQQEELQLLANQTRCHLQALEPRPEDQQNLASISARVRRTQHGVLLQEFLAVTSRLHAAQSHYRQRCLQRVRRHLHITGNSAVTDEELEEMLESGQSEVFVSNVLGAARATRAALDEVTSRHRELQRLERAMRELQELFGALGAAVEGQGEAINRIELHILQSGTAVHKGGRQLRAAQEQQGKARRKRLIMAACLVLTLVILVAIIAASVAAG
ncbi:syntaxin-4-like isoform X2 [Tympanuchus pallidicinctus]|uniref:syntaxin-4-like isoform X2 n=1 Tax=Tympanuchus pallidicinctus TaxID=109042 RepID=UPI002286F477|nr:syntaxin-4-like isoform X2 [Tympanuchus pallidicinctus]XP_052523191.1 syntaxin-4-like isoform X2 [Tympanuchus pallidicinctus]XP_052523192.1 syntaxin-4-like isoform X2 [Tympanuchus pallidicinctus]XP_052523193.1 syntaxin-4-like isoform X2 [Tympanuchus pallidicinctus]XP_052523194.1 syntaxin-4-like isoform X2 [Tympanuchus pallidicinctus]XP_052523195.1 syntaxin-4-like isoform X2 [Tympanuchus pallidicinctus]XP_052523196.1 syntaxin-4-like isoform X2 [Tympanuchus pallidicinctus]XP_052523197.1 syn